MGLSGHMEYSRGSALWYTLQIFAAENLPPEILLPTGSHPWVWDIQYTQLLLYIGPLNLCQQMVKVWGCGGAELAFLLTLAPHFLPDSLCAGARST